MSIVRILLAIFIPPVAVFLVDGVGMHLVLNIVLWFFGWVPAVIHAFYLMGVRDGRR